MKFRAIIRTVVICLVAMCCSRFPAANSAESQLSSVWQAGALSRDVLIGDTDGVRAELAHGVDPNQRDPVSGLAPLHQAMSSRAEVVKILLEAGADPNVRTADFGNMPSKQWTPLFFAVNNSRPDLVELLIKHRATVDLTDSDNRTPLSYAIAKRDKKTADLLLKAAAKLSTAAPIVLPQPSSHVDWDASQHSPSSAPKLYQAVLMHDRTEVATLLDGGADPNERASTGLAPLHQAMKSDVEICQLLLDHGADVNARVLNPNGFSNAWTPVFYAAYYGRDDLIPVLVKYGARLDIADAMGKSPLSYARERKKETTVRLLLTSGAKD